MSACYLYGIIPAAKATGPPFLAKVGPGVRDAPLQVVVSHELAAVISAWPSPGGSTEPLAAATDVWRHEQVVEGIMERAPILPARFGTLLGGAGQVAQLLAGRHPEFLTALARVAGRVEMGLRVLWTPPAPDPTEANTHDILTPGRQYLYSRASQVKQEEALQAKANTLVAILHATLQPVIVDQWIQVLPTKRLLLSAAYLVPRTAVAAFLAQVEALRQSWPDLSFLSSGPWPAYHFTGPAQNERKN